MALDAYAWLNRVAEIAAPVRPPGPVTAPAPTVEPAPTPQQGQAPVGVAHAFPVPASAYTQMLARQRADEAAKTAAQVDNTAEGDLVDHTWPERHEAMVAFFNRHPRLVEKPALL